jgi:hypothetical protein
MGTQVTISEAVEDMFASHHCCEESVVLFCDRVEADLLPARREQAIAGGAPVTQPKPTITGTTHTLPFHQLSPRDFERMCLWLVEREGFERAEHLGAAGSEQGRDIVAWHLDQLWAFQCKRVQHFGPKSAEAEVDKVLGLPEDLRPAAPVFLVACDVSAETRRRARARCARRSRTPTLAVSAAGWRRSEDPKRRP